MELEQVQLATQVNGLYLMVERCTKTQVNFDRSDEEIEWYIVWQIDVRDWTQPIIYRLSDYEIDKRSVDIIGKADRAYYWRVLQQLGLTHGSIEEYEARVTG